MVRNLKGQKAAKPQIDEAVKTLLTLKTEYKAVTNTEWKPPTVVPATKAADGAEISAKIVVQGDKVRDLKAKKAEKSVVDAEVKLLLQLKADYKAATGQDWKPEAAPKSPSKPLTVVDDAEILKKIAAQGDKIRDLKAKKAEKAIIDDEVKILLQLKADYKALTGQEWKPGVVPKAQAPESPKVTGDDLNAAGDDPKTAELIKRVNAQGNIVRELKSKKAAKEEVDAAVKILLDLKAEYKTLTGTDFPAPGKAPAKPAKESKAAAPKEKPAKQKAAVKEKRPVEVSYVI